MYMTIVTYLHVVNFYTLHVYSLIETSDDNFIELLFMTHLIFKNQTDKFRCLIFFSN